jgi:hypothetical protein
MRQMLRKHGAFKSDTFARSRMRSIRLGRETPTTSATVNAMSASHFAYLALVAVLLFLFL